MQLEKMDAFFAARLQGYEEHMLKNIEGAAEFYPFTARQLPQTPGAAVLDLGCGTGLELRWYYPLNPTAKVTGIDLSQDMLDALRRQYAQYQPNLLCGSYFEIPLGENCFDGVVSVESLHHFTGEEKLPLYQKLYKSLKPGSSFILTDYFAESDFTEQLYRQTLLALKKAQNLRSDVFYHYDTPLTVDHERNLLLEAGFDRVEILRSWSATCTLEARKGTP